MLEITGKGLPGDRAAGLSVAGLVIVIGVAFGLTSLFNVARVPMNQALIGAMTGAAAARSRRTVHAAALYGVLRGWLIGPGAAIALSYAVSRLVAAAAGTHLLVAAR